MKHLKRYNESKENIEHLHHIFADLIEDWGAEHVEIPETHDTHSYYEIVIKEPNMKNTPRQDGVDKNLEEYLNSHIEKSEKMIQFCNEIKSCLDRIKDAFPKCKAIYSVIVNQDESSRSIRIEIYNLNS